MFMWKPAEPYHNKHQGQNWSMQVFGQMMLGGVYRVLFPLMEILWGWGSDGKCSDDTVSVLYSLMYIHFNLVWCVLIFIFDNSL